MQLDKSSQSLPHALFKKLDHLSINTKRRVNSLNTGSRASFKKGHGIEFADYREYQPGDNIKHIDWNLYARSDRTYVKTFQEEQSLELLIIVDGSRSMFSNDLQKWQYAKELTLALAYIGFLEREKVTVKIIGSDKVGPLSGINSIGKISNSLEKTQKAILASKFEESLYPEIIKTLEKCKYPSVCVVISDFFYEQELVSKMFRLLSSKNLDLVAIQLLGNFDLEPFGINQNFSIGNFQAIDSETGEEQLINFNSDAKKTYQEKLRNHCKNIEEITKQSKANYSLAKANEDIFEFLAKNLVRIGLLK